MTSTLILPITGNLSLLKKVINNRPVAVCLQGASISLLEERIKTLIDLDLCWASINRFNVIQDYILNQIDQPLEIVMEIADVAYPDDYDMAVRIPRIEAFIKRNNNGVLITKTSILTNMKKTSSALQLDSKRNCVFVDVESCNFCIPNSLALYLLLLTRFGAKSIFLFGFDGLSSENNNIVSYYRPKSLEKERQIGFGNQTACFLHLDTPLFDTTFAALYQQYCSDLLLKPIPILNCNPSSHFTVFSKLTYSDIRRTYADF